MRYERRSEIHPGIFCVEMLSEAEMADLEWRKHVQAWEAEVYDEIDQMTKEALAKIKPVTRCPSDHLRRFLASTQNAAAQQLGLYDPYQGHRNLLSGFLGGVLPWR